MIYTSTELLAHNKMFDELERAFFDLKTCVRSPHYGYKNALVLLGYEAYGNDSKTTFRCFNGKFYFSVCSRDSWRISDIAVIKTKDKGEVSLSINSQDDFIRDWRRKGLTEQDLVCCDLPKPQYMYFLVYNTTNEQSPLKKFTNFETAKKFAYDIAIKECKDNYDVNHIVGKHFLQTPRDTTKHNTPYLVFYEYYVHNEISQGVYVMGI